MSSNISIDSTDSDVFYVEQLSDEPSPRRNNSPNILSSTELSEHPAARMPLISTIASLQPHVFTINDDSKEPTIPYGFGRQLPIVPPSLNDLNLPPTLSTSWRQWLWYTTHRTPMMTTIAAVTGALGSVIYINAPNECQRIQQPRDIIYQYRRQYFQYQR